MAEAKSKLAQKETFNPGGIGDTPPPGSARRFLTQFLFDVRSALHSYNSRTIHECGDVTKLEPDTGGILENFIDLHSSTANQMQPYLRFALGFFRSRNLTWLNQLLFREILILRLYSRSLTYDDRGNGN